MEGQGFIMAAVEIRSKREKNELKKIRKEQ